MNKNLRDFLEYLVKNPIDQMGLLAKYNSKYERFNSLLVEEFSFIFSDLWIQKEDSIKFIRWRITALLNNSHPWIEFKKDVKNKATVSPHGELYRKYRILGF